MEVTFIGNCICALSIICNISNTVVHQTLIFVCREKLKMSRDKVSILSQELQQSRMMRTLGFEFADLDNIGEMDSAQFVSRYLKNRSLQYNRVGMRKHIDPSKRADKLREETCCKQNCLQNLNDNHRSALELSIARWDDMTRQQKSGQVFQTMLEMRSKRRTRVDEVVASGVRVSKSGEKKRVYPSDMHDVHNQRMQYSIMDPHSKTDIPVCLCALRKVTNSFGGSLQTAVNKQLDDGCEQFFTEYSFARRSRSCTKSATVISWVEHQILLMADINPANEKKMWLPYDNWEIAYHHYSQMVKTGIFGEWGVESPAGESLFRKIVKVHFKEHIRFAKRYNTFTKCNTCSDFKIQIKRAGANSVSGRVWLKHYFRHLMWQAKCRLKYHSHRSKAKAFPHKYLSLIIDGSDNHSFEIPFPGDKRKDWGGLDRPKTRSTGVLMHSDANTSASGGLRLYITDERTRKGTNFNIIAILHSLLHEKDARGGTLPPYLYMQMDSAGDNKSKTMMRFCEYLVKMGVFLKVKVCMLPVGHTHEDIDAGFGRLNRKFVEQGVVTATTAQGLARARTATAATRCLVWIKVCLCVCS